MNGRPLHLHADAQGVPLQRVDAQDLQVLGPASHVYRRDTGQCRGRERGELGCVELHPIAERDRRGGGGTQVDRELDRPIFDAPDARPQRHLQQLRELVRRRDIALPSTPKR